MRKIIAYVLFAGCLLCACSKHKEMQTDTKVAIDKECVSADALNTDSNSMESADASYGEVQNVTAEAETPVTRENARKRDLEKYKDFRRGISQ